MWRNETEEPVRLNWTAILSIGGSLAAILTLWAVLIRGIQALLR
jgi:hypothetical protein